MRINWLDEDTNVPALEEQVGKLKHFTDAMADGIIDADELSTQNKAVVSAMEAVCSLLREPTALTWVPSP